MKQPSGNNYPLKVWGFTILTTPFVISLIMIFNGVDLSRGSAAIVLLIFFGALISMPALTLFWVLHDYLIIKSNLKVSTKKLLFAASGVILTCLTFFIMGWPFYSQTFSGYLLPIVYLVVLTFFAVLLKIPPTRKKDTAIQ